MDLAHAAIWVSDLDRAIDFYATLGLERRWSFELDGVENVYLGDEGGDVLQLRYDPDRTTPIAPSRADVDHLALGVADEATLDATYADAIDAGGSGLSAPHPVEAADSYAAFLEDPEGYALELVAPLE